MYKSNPGRNHTCLRLDLVNRDMRQAAGLKYVVHTGIQQRFLKLWDIHMHEQVAVERTRPHGQVIGIDLIPAQPPKGVATFQGDFLSPVVQQLVKEFIAQTHYDRLSRAARADHNDENKLDSNNTLIEQPSYIDLERHSTEASKPPSGSISTKSTQKNLVDVRQIAPATTSTCTLLALTSIQIVLSDMSAPWEQTSGFSSKTLSNPYDRLMNTSGIASRDHAGSMVRMKPELVQTSKDKR